jgi:hypothetical protein
MFAVNVTRNGLGPLEGEAATKLIFSGPVISSSGSSLPPEQPTAEQAKQTNAAKNIARFTLIPSNLILYLGQAQYFNN